MNPEFALAFMVHIIFWPRILISYFKIPYNRYVIQIEIKLQKKITFEKQLDIIKFNQSPKFPKRDSLIVLCHLSTHVFAIYKNILSYANTIFIEFVMK